MTATPPRPLPPIAEQVLVAFVTTALAILAEASALVIRHFDAWTLRPFGGALTHLWAMSLPIALAVAVLIGLALTAASMAPVAPRVLTRGLRLRRLFTRSPSLFATALGTLASAAVFVYGSYRITRHFAERYHDAQLAAWTAAAALLALLVACVAFRSVAAAASRPLGQVLGPFASVGAVGVLALLASVTAAVALAVTFPRLFRAYDPVRLVSPPILLGLYGLAMWGTRARLRRHSVEPRTVWIAAGAAVAVALIALSTTAFTYGGSNRTRAILERQSVLGLTLVHLYGRMTDWDGDGHGFAFGGGDCDDGDARVYPGAPDEPGDGLDADCFDGDGTRPVARHSDGAYGRRPEGLSQPNFLVLLVDALRPDHLSCAGYERPTSPNIDRFAEQASWFTRVTSQSPRSIRAIPSMMTGFYPSQIAYGPEYLFPSLLPENVTVPEVLAEAGYETAAVIGTNYFLRLRDFWQGFASITQLPMYKPPRRRSVDEGLRHLTTLEAAGKPWFLMVHFFNVHEPYLPDGHASLFGDRPIDKYDTEITLADAEVQRMLDQLHERGLDENTVVILASDHGDAFMEHGHLGHSRSLYPEEIGCVLMVRAPGVAPRRIDAAVGLLDFAPTVLNLAGLPVPRPMPARSLVPFMTGEREAPTDRILFAEVFPDGLFPYDSKSIQQGSLKLHWQVREGTVQLFDTAADPGELNDLSDDRQEQATEFLNLLRAWVSHTNRAENRHADVVAANRLTRVPNAITHPMDVRFPTFTFRGFDLPRQSFRVGERIAVDFFYEVERETETELFFYVSFTGPPGFAIPEHFHGWHYPLNGRYRTSMWAAGEILRDPVQMVIPNELRHPVTLKLTLTVHDDRRQPVSFEPDPRGTHVLDLAEIRIR